MVVAAKTLALSAADLFENGALLTAARAEFDQRRAGHPYQSRIPASHKPPLNYRDNPTAGGQ
jgi:aminobenzoyl-glutamate utilization protein B